MLRIPILRKSGSFSRISEGLFQIRNLAFMSRRRRSSLASENESFDYAHIPKCMNVYEVVTGYTVNAPAFDSANPLTKLKKDSPKLDLLSLLRDPVDDGSVAGYSAKIPNPICLAEIENRLLGAHESKQYASPDMFALDMRRIFGNFLRFNYASGVDKRRAEARKLLQLFEDEWAKEFPGISAVWLQNRFM